MHVLGTHRRGAGKFTRECQTKMAVPFWPQQYELLMIHSYYVASADLLMVLLRLPIHSPFKPTTPEKIPRQHYSFTHPNYLFWARAQRWVRHEPTLRELNLQKIWLLCESFPSDYKISISQYISQEQNTNTIIFKKWMNSLLFFYQWVTPSMTHCYSPGCPFHSLLNLQHSSPSQLPTDDTASYFTVKIKALLLLLPHSYNHQHAHPHICLASTLVDEQHDAPSPRVQLPTSLTQASVSMHLYQSSPSPKIFLIRIW